MIMYVYLAVIELISEPPVAKIHYVYQISILTKRTSIEAVVPAARAAVQAVPVDDAHLRRVADRARAWRPDRLPRRQQRWLCT